MDKFKHELGQRVFVLGKDGLCIVKGRGITMTVFSFDSTAKNSGKSA